MFCFRLKLWKTNYMKKTPAGVLAKRGSFFGAVGAALSEEFQSDKEPLKRRVVGVVDITPGKGRDNGWQVV